MCHNVMCFTQKKNPALKLHVITLDYRTYALSKQHFRQHAYVSRILRSSGPPKKNEEGITQKHRVQKANSLIQSKAVHTQEAMIR